MITSRQILNEEWLLKSNYGMISGDVFINPTSSDIKELYTVNKEHEIRFIIDNQQKKVFVWDVWVLHGWVARDLGLFERFNNIYPDRLIPGVGKIVGGKIVFKEADIINTIIKVVGNKRNLFKNNDDWNYLKDMANQDWDWCKKYIDISKLIDKIREIVA